MEFNNKTSLVKNMNICNEQKYRHGFVGKCDDNEEDIVLSDLTDFKLDPTYCLTTENANEKLKETVYTGLKKLYGKNPSKLITDRLERELNIIMDSGHSHFFYDCKIFDR